MAAATEVDTPYDGLRSASEGGEDNESVVSVSASDYESDPGASSGLDHKRQGRRPTPVTQSLNASSENEMERKPTLKGNKRIITEESSEEQETFETNKDVPHTESEFSDGFSQDHVIDDTFEEVVGSDDSIPIPPPKRRLNGLGQSRKSNTDTYDPELFGLRRSSRPHIPSNTNKDSESEDESEDDFESQSSSSESEEFDEDSDSDYGSRSKKKKSNLKAANSRRAAAKRSRFIMDEDDEVENLRMQGDAESNSSDGEWGSKKKSSRRRKLVSRAFRSSTESPLPEVRFSMRSRSVKSYN
ncbi:hypothetical protein K493DRAFT_46814 [Basidiobolus meristosporus CBS 931.73]|uniref:Uncharacterized protein n=1 Tax=Basidiobolus meristosporus CBS 931.73 TaxID=1314790 RepID=A0A1Y1ZD46_9FUNG|nr:hypothetical protein K493DRAFT_46814 [Basidiobolus meristosporus CBS 931.73]|eukprot:ORY08126.1 hypothetical protein K493DRAFT_46814 [Basidiobolus meristosporus CBS 931.73]